MIVGFIVAGIVLLLVIVGGIVWLLRKPELISPAAALAAFDAERAELERQFFVAARATGKPRGLRWKSCDFGAEVTLARDLRGRELVALVPVTIAFEAIPGSDMEGLPAVGNLRSATAVFSYRDRCWTTAGRAVFNLSPAEAIRHFRGQYEPVTQDA